MMGHNSSQKVTPKFILLVTLLWLLFLCSNGFKISFPEFSEPLKNMSVTPGSNVGLTCNVRNLGGNRVMWVKKEEEKEVLIGINSLIVTKNSRISVSLLPSSGDVTQSTLYINSVDKEDDGSYNCIVNSSPMISQLGTLEVREAPQQETEKIPSTTSLPPTIDSTTAESFVDSVRSTVMPTEVEECPKPACDDPQRHVICIDLDNMWSDTREKVQYLFSWFYSGLPNIF